MAAHWSSRLGARRGAKPPHRASRATLPEGQCAAMKWVLITEIWYKRWRPQLAMVLVGVFGALLLAALGHDNAERAARDLPPVRVPIGIHTGMAVVGNIGSHSRINYTLVGDTVNAANRVEQLAKEIDLPEADVQILISADTAAALPPDELALQAMGSWAVRGRELQIYRLYRRAGARRRAAP